MDSANKTTPDSFIDSHNGQIHTEERRRVELAPTLSDDLRARLSIFLHRLHL
jgi:hypothetical protein